MDLKLDVFVIGIFCRMTQNIRTNGVKTNGNKYVDFHVTYVLYQMNFGQIREINKRVFYTHTGPMKFIHFVTTQCDGKLVAAAARQSD
jgi:hypothetical protein